MTVNEFLTKIVRHEDLTREEARKLAELLFDVNTPQAITAAILTSLKMKGESTDEILGFVEILRKGMKRIEYKGNLIDCCGTGGDGQSTFNISTATALVLAACGVKVAKHGNRSASGISGSADVLEALGANINVNEQQIRNCLERCGFAFIFAPNFHPLMKSVGPVRRELKIRTIFNLIGPLLNPTGLKRQIIGVFDIETAQKLARVIMKFPYEHVCIVHSSDGMDEVSIYAKTQVFEIKKGKLMKFVIDPLKLGVKGKNKEEIKVRDVEESKKKLFDVLNGKNGDLRKIVLLNTSLGLYVMGRCININEGIEIAGEAIDSGKALVSLNRFMKVSNE